MSIPALPADCLSTTYETIPNFSSRAVTALIYDQHDQTRQVIIFPFPVNSRGLVNMVAWWHLQLFLEMPITACWFIDVEREFLQPHFPDVDWPEAMMCFCAEAPAGLSPMSVRNKANPLLAQSLNDWPNLPLAIACHEIAGNYRKVGIVRAGKNNYSLYDGAGTFGGEHWTAQLLRSFHIPVNPLALLAGWCDNIGRVDEDVAQDVLAHGCTLTQIHELEFYLYGMLPQEDAKTASKFLQQRSNLGLSRWNTIKASNS